MEGTSGTAFFKAFSSRAYSAWTSPLLGKGTNASNTFEAALKDYVPEQEQLALKCQASDPTSVFDDLAGSASDSQSDAQSEGPDSPHAPLPSKLVAVLPSLALPRRRTTPGPATPHPEEEPAAVVPAASKSSASLAPVAAAAKPEGAAEPKEPCVANFIRHSVFVAVAVVAAAALGARATKKKAEMKRA